MAGSQQYIKRVLQYEHDKAALQATLQAGEKLRNEFRAEAQAAKQVDVAGAAASKRLVEQARNMDALQKGTRIAIEQYDKLTQSIKQNNDEQNKTPAGDKKFKAGSAISGAAGILGSAGGSAAAEPLRVVGDIEQVTSAFGNLGPLAGVTSVGILAVGAAFAKMNSDLEPARQALDGALAGQRAYYDFINGNATTEDAKKRIEELKGLADDERSIIAENQNALTGAFKDAQQGYGDLIARLAFAVGDADDKVGKSTTDAQARLSGYEAEMKRLQQTLENGGFKTADLTAKENELTKAREAAVPKLEQLAEQAARLQQDAADRQLEISEDRRIRDEREQRNYDRQQLQAQRSLNDNLTKIGLQGADRLAQIRTQGNSRLVDIDKNIGQLRANFMASEIERTRKFYEEEKKSDARNKKERLRRIEDQLDAERDAAEANDVIAFIHAQRAAEKDLRRMAEDADEQTQERQAQFDEETRLAREKHEAEIAAQEASKVQILADIQSQLDAERTRIEESKKAAQAQFDEQKKLQDEERNIRLKDQSEDDKRADDRRKQALDKALADIDAKARKEAGAIGLVGTALNNLINAVQSGATAAIARIISASGTFSSGLGSSSGTQSANNGARPGGGGLRPTPFGFGGNVTKPTRAMLGERPGYGDLVFSYSKSKGPGSVMQGMGGDTYNFGDFNIGNGMSKQEVIAAIKDGLRAKMQGEMDARRPR